MAKVLAISYYFFEWGIVYDFLKFQMNGWFDFFYTFRINNFYCGPLSALKLCQFYLAIKIRGCDAKVATGKIWNNIFD